MTDSQLPPPPPPPPPANHQTADTSIEPDTSISPSSRWGLGDAFASYGVFLGSSFAIGLVIALLEGPEDVLADHYQPLVLGVPQLMLGVHAWWVASAKGAGPRRDFGFSIAVSDIPRGLALFAVGIIGAGLVAAAIAALGVEPPNATVADIATESSDGGGVTIWLVLLAVLAFTLVPVVEELVYRGLWWSALLKRGMNQHVVLVVTSAVFAVAHLEPARTPILFALGLALGWGRLMTGRIGASIFAHCFINLVGMIAVLTAL